MISRSLLNLVVNPTEIVVDFDLAIRNACEKIWPNVSLVGYVDFNHGGGQFKTLDWVLNIKVNHK